MTRKINQINEDEISDSLLKELEVRIESEVGFKPTPQSRLALRAYLAGYSLVLAGPPGTGKDHFWDGMRIVDKLRQVRRLDDDNQCCERPDTSLCLLSLQTLALKGREEVSEILRNLESRPVVLRDIGAEPMYGSFGGKCELLPIILESRLEGGRARTHMTTNLTLEELGARYGDRVKDRIEHLFRIVVFDGPSMRVLLRNECARSDLERIQFNLEMEGFHNGK